MSLTQSLHALGTIPMPLPTGPGLCAVRTTYTLTADLAVNDIIEMGFIPENCVPVDLILDTDDLGSTGTMSVGLLSSDKTSLDATWLAASDVNTAATAYRADAAGLLAMARTAATNTQRPYGVKVAVDTTASSGTVGLTMVYRLA